MKIHISERGNKYKTLCGKSPSMLSASFWFEAVEDGRVKENYQTSYNRFNWCLVCKRMYNSDVEPNKQLK